MQTQQQHQWGGTQAGEETGLWKQFTAVPNLLSMMRVLPIPAIYACLRQGEPFYEGVAIALIVAALSTDFLDGYVARRHGIKTKLGLILDPTADKLLISSLAIFAAMFKGLPFWMAGVIVGKDIAIFTGAAVIYLRRGGLVLLSDRWGRGATMISSLAFILFFLSPGPYGLFGLGIAIFCIFVSSILYGRNFIRLLRPLPFPGFSEDGRG